MYSVYPTLSFPYAEVHPPATFYMDLSDLGSYSRPHEVVAGRLEKWFQLLCPHQKLQKKTYLPDLLLAMMHAVAIKVPGRFEWPSDEPEGSKALQKCPFRIFGSQRPI